MGNETVTGTKTSVKTKVIVGLAAVAIVGMAAAGTYLDTLKEKLGESSKITVTKPSSAATVTWNSRGNVTWDIKGKADLGQVKIELLKNDEKVATITPTGGVPASDKKFGWIPSTHIADLDEIATTDTFKVVVRQTGTGKIWGASSAFTFVLGEGNIALSLPNGGEEYKLDKTVPITWIADAAVEKVSVRLFMNGTLKAKLAAAESATAGGYQWKIKNTLGKNDFKTETAKFKIRLIGYDAEGNVVAADESDKSFKILGGVGKPEDTDGGGFCNPVTCSGAFYGCTADLSACVRCNGETGCAAGQTCQGGTCVDANTACSVANCASPNTCVGNTCTPPDPTPTPTPTPPPAEDAGLVSVRCGHYQEDNGNIGKGGRSGLYFKVNGVESLGIITVHDGCKDKYVMGEWYCDGNKMRLKEVDCRTACGANMVGFCSKDEGRCMFNPIADINKACQGTVSGSDGVDLFTGKPTTFVACKEDTSGDGGVRINAKVSLKATTGISFLDNAGAAPWYGESYCSGNMLNQLYCDGNVPKIKKVDCAANGGTCYQPNGPDTCYYPTDSDNVGI